MLASNILMKHSITRWIGLGAFLVLNHFYTPAWADTWVSAKDDGFEYVGRVDFSSPDAPLLSWPGTSIRARFTGSVLSLTLEDQKGNNFYNVFIDGERLHPYVLEAKKGKHEYLIASQLKPGEHELEIYKRTEGEEGWSRFYGLTLEDNARLVPRQKTKKRKMEIFGDSISSGMGNEGADNGEDHLASEKNHYWSYGAVTARALEAELHTISKSGIGIMVSWFPFTMPEYYDQLDASSNNDSVWDFSSWTPDLVVINLFQNDKWLVDREKRLQPIPNDTQRIQAYIDFVSVIRAHYPKAHIVCALGSMDATQDEQWPGYILEAVAQMTKNGDKNLSTVFFPFNGYGQHPRVAQHKANAAILTQHIEEVMGW